MNPIHLDNIATALADAELKRVPAPPPTTLFPDLDLHDAFAVQRATVATRLATGAVVRGYRVTRQPPASRLDGDLAIGHVLSDAVVAESTVIDISRLCAPRLTSGLALVLAEPLPAAGATAADVLRCTAFVMPVLEINDSRIAGTDLTLPDVVADNSSAGLFVLGGRATPLLGLDLRTLGVAVRVDGQVVATGAGGAVFGNPVSAAAALANALQASGITTVAGQLLITGPCTAPIPATAGNTVRADFEHLGHVGIRFEQGAS